MVTSFNTLACSSAPGQETLQIFSVDSGCRRRVQLSQDLAVPQEEKPGETAVG